jgi:hypothetical protein
MQTFFMEPGFGKISQNHFQEWVVEELNNAVKMRKKYGQWDESHCSLSSYM